MNRPTELENIKVHATSVDSLGSRYKDGPNVVVSQLESEYVVIDRQQSSLKHSEYESSLNASPQQQEASEEAVVAKESLADWGVLACVFLSNFIAAIDLTGFGVFYPFLVEHFDATTAAVGWCGSIHGFFQSAVGMFASYPIQSYGCRLPGVVGSLLFSIGLSLSYLAPNLTMIYFTYGVIAGSGSGVAFLSTSIIIHQRFTRNRNLASGISFLGFGCGGIVGSVITNYLIQSYGWRGAFLILAAIQAQRIPLCLFCRTPERLTSQSNHASGVSQRRISGQMILRYLKETFNFSILRQARYSVFAVAFILDTFCVSGYWPHTVNRAVHVGLSRDQGVAAAALISSISTVSRVPVSFIANHPKVKSSLVFGTGMVFAFLSIVAIFINPGLIGTMTSTALFGMHLGWIFDVTRDYNKAFAIIGCMAFVSGSLMVALTFVTRLHRKSVSKDIEFPVSYNGVDKPPTSKGQS